MQLVLGHGAVGGKVRGRLAAAQGQEPGVGLPVQLVAEERVAEGVGVAADLVRATCGVDTECKAAKK